MRFGPNRILATVLRRAPQAPDATGATRGAFASVGQIWASWRAVSGQRMIETGLVEDASNVIARVNDTPTNGAITIADRLSFDATTRLAGQWAIIAAAPPDRLGRFIELQLKRVIGD